MLKLADITSKIFLFFIFISVLSSIFSIGFSLNIKPLLDRSLQNHQIMSDSLIKFIIFAFFMTLLKHIRFIIFDTFSISVEKKLTEKIVLKIRERSIDYFENIKEGALSHLINNRIEEFSEFLGNNISNIFYLPIYFLFVFVSLIIIDYRISIIIIPTIFVGVYLDLKNSDKLLEFSNIYYESERNISAFQKEMIENALEIKIENMDNYIVSQHSDKVDDFISKENKLNKRFQISYIPALINEYLPNIVLVLIIIFKFANNNPVTYGGFLTILSLTSNVSLPFANYLRSLTKLKKIEPLMDELLSIIHIEEENCIIHTDSDYIINIENLSFSYKDNLILNDTNLKVKRGEKIGIIGKSGSGKSTLLKLIIGIYKPDMGKISVLNILTSENIEEILRNISYVDNKNYMLDGDIRYNIFLKDIKDFPEKEIYLKRISEKIYMYDILNLKNEDSINFDIRNLSGGQKSKISIARALLKEESKILILDEPSASMDLKSEKGLQKLLEESDKTIILTTHRKSLLEICDRIYNLENGNNILNF
ncbi:MAG: ABC transporter ATP-binding protein [Peptoniphilaceae bacterium]|nr:ABC transporter ATP-binding protein [Peptoniphilaceae bacterium]MDY3737635.1 ABC transporter ATP-binding protein [Peptoniphilaceae bacterium]